MWQSLSYGMVEKWVVANEQAQRHQENPAGPIGLHRWLAPAII